MKQTAPEEGWWVSYAAKWKPGGTWSGPDGVFTYATNATGTILRQVGPEEVFRVLREVTPTTPAAFALPPLDEAQASARADLKACVPPDADGAIIAMFPIAAIHWA